MGQQNPEICTVTTANTGAAASITATIPAVSGQYGYLSGFSVSGLGATTATTVNVTVGPFTGNVTHTYVFAVPAPVTSAATSLIVTYPNAIQSNGRNAVITVTVPSFGAGNTSATVQAWGYYGL